MGFADKPGKVGIGAEMGIDAGEVGDPVAVIACAFMALSALNRAIENGPTQIAVAPKAWI
jgi:hypothetical protein